VPDAAYEIRVYSGADAAFVLYEDAGDGYQYERGEFALVHLNWREQEQELLISAREGYFPLLVKERDYRVTFISEFEQEVRTVRYTGNPIRLSLFDKKAS
jgi:alpha-D-xyloside xylohydrolase